MVDFQYPHEITMPRNMRPNTMRRKGRSTTTAKPGYRGRHFNRVRIPATINGLLGTSVKMTHKMSHSFQLDPPSGGVALLDWKANDMFNPYTGHTHSPYGFSRLSELYSHFTVTSTTFKIRAINTSGSKVFLSVNVYPAFNTVDNSIEGQVEMPGCQWRLLTADNFGSGNPSAYITRHIDFPAFFGRDPQSFVGSADYRGNGLSSPIELAHLIILVRPYLGGVDPLTVSFIVEAEYTAVWTEAQKLSTAL